MENSINDSNKKLEETFNTTADKLRNNKTLKLDNTKKLKFYGLYKVVTAGPYSDSNKMKEGWFDFETKYKNEAWQKCSIYSKEDAMIEYIQYYSEITGEKINLDFLSEKEVKVSISELTLDIPEDLSSQSLYSSNAKEKKEEMEKFLASAPEQEKIFQRLKDEIYSGELITIETISNFEKENKIDLKTFTDSLGQTCLHIAVDAMNFSCVDSLIKNGYAKDMVNKGDNVNMTPMHIAGINFDANIYDLLLTLKPDLKLKDNEGKTSKNYLEENDEVEVPKKFLRDE